MSRPLPPHPAAHRTRSHRRVAVATTVIAAACGIAAVGAPSALAADPSPSEVTAFEIPQERIAAAVAQIDTFAPSLLQRSGVPGMSVAVVHKGQVVYAKGFGVRSTKTNTPVDADTVFQLASLSKPVGATVVARAVTTGKVAWDSKVAPLLPGFRLNDPWVTKNLTVADLYTHRSGLPGQAGDVLEDLGFDRKQILQRLRYEPLSPFRTNHAYANFGLTVGAEAVARAERTDWATLSQRNLYGPLGMTATSSRHSDLVKRKNRALLHVPTDRGWQPLYDRNADAQSPAGGVSSSANDMTKWLRLQLANGRYDGKQLVSPAALQTMRTAASQPHPPSSPTARSAFYGMGVGIDDDATGRVRFSHSGGFELGTGTRMVMLPAEDLGIVVLTNGQVSGLAEATAETFLELAERGTLTRDWLGAYRPIFVAMMANPSVLADQQRPAKPQAAQRPATYVGTYRNRYYGNVSVTAKGRKLTLRMGPKRRAYPLTHWSGNRWSYISPGENGRELTAVDFRVFGASGAASIRIENLDANGLGTLRRVR